MNSIAMHYSRTHIQELTPCVYRIIYLFVSHACARFASPYIYTR